VTVPAPAGHSVPMTGAPEADSPPRPAAPPTFERLYADHFDFVWSSMRRLGVPDELLDDAVQDVFVVVHRRLHEFEGRSSAKTWLFGIALRVARDHRRQRRRKGGHEPLPARLADRTPGPLEQAAAHEAIRFVDEFLDTLDEDKRAVFILADLEELTAPEIAESLGIKVNTVYSRLRLARRAFEQALARQERTR